MNRPGLVLASFPLLALAAAAYAHNAICDCYGGKAAGVPLRVVDAAGKVLIDGAMSAESDYTFKKPAGDFRVEFDAGQGHVVTIDGRDIEE